MVVIGLTGGIASGKSTVSAALTARGAVVVDADKVGHEVYLPGSEGFRRVVEAFGQGVVSADGEINRQALGAIVFGDPAQRERLQAIVWPVMKDIMRQRIKQLRTDGAGVVVLEAAVLFEAAWQDLVDQVWVVSVPPAVAEQRLIERNGLTPEQAQARIAAQLSNAERERRANVVIDNSGSRAAAEARVATLWDTVAAAGHR